MALLLFLAASVGKIGATLLMVPLGRLSWREAWTVGIGLDARLTTEIIVARLLFDAQLIDQQLFTALVAAASVSAITVPVAFAILVSKWGNSLKTPPSPDGTKGPSPDRLAHDQTSSPMETNEKCLQQR